MKHCDVWINLFTERSFTNMFCEGVLWELSYVLCTVLQSVSFLWSLDISLIKDTQGELLRLSCKFMYSAIKRLIYGTVHEFTCDFCRHQHIVNLHIQDNS